MVTEQGNPLPWTLRVGAILAAALFAAWCALMSPEWLTEPNLTHGLFIPIVLAALLYEGARSRTPRYLPDNAGMDVLQGAVAVFALLAAAAGGFYGDTMGWDHALAEFFLGAAMAALVLVLLMALGRDGARVLPFGWPCAAAVLLCLLCAPVPPGTSSRLTSALQLGVTESVLRILNAVGVPAFRTGNVIELAHARVGVEEACSGLRSLVSCVFAGIFISAAWMRRPVARVVLVLVAAPLALAMNLLRSLGLAYAAGRGLRIDGLLHDVAGIAILVATSALLVFMGAVLGGAHEAPARPLPPRGPFRGAPGWIALCALIAAAALTVSWAMRPLEFASPKGALPNLASIIPDRAEGWEVSAPEDLRPYAPELRTGCLMQRTYTRLRPWGREEVTLYVAYWRPGQASVSLVSSHTPDMCWPGQGWDMLPEATGTEDLRVERRALPPSQARTFVRPEEKLYVWYWHLYGGRPVEDFDTHSPRRLLSEVVAHGIRANRSQIFVRISANAGWSQVADGPLLATFFSGLRRWGF